MNNNTINIQQNGQVGATYIFIYYWIICLGQCKLINSQAVSEPELAKKSNFQSMSRKEGRKKNT